MAPTNILGLTSLGTFHTAIALLALGAGALALVRNKEISPRTMAGKVYVIMTVITLTSHEAPELQAATGVLFILFRIGATLQSLRLRASHRQRVPDFYASASAKVG